MTLHNQCPCQISTSYTLWSLKCSLDKLFPPPANSPIRTPLGENNTSTALKGYEVTNVIMIWIQNIILREGQVVSKLTFT